MSKEKLEKALDELEEAATASWISGSTPEFVASLTTVRARIRDLFADQERELGRVRTMLQHERGMGIDPDYMAGRP